MSGSCRCGGRDPTGVTLPVIGASLSGLDELSSKSPPYSWHSHHFACIFCSIEVSCICRPPGCLLSCLKHPTSITMGMPSAATNSWFGWQFVRCTFAKLSGSDFFATCVFSNTLFWSDVLLVPPRTQCQWWAVRCTVGLFFFLISTTPLFFRLILKANSRNSVVIDLPV